MNANFKICVRDCSGAEGVHSYKIFATQMFYKNEWSDNGTAESSTFAKQKVRPK